MNIEELLIHNSIKLPKSWKELGYISYYECVIGEGINFIKLIEKMEEFDEFNDKYLGVLSKEHLVEASRAFFQTVIKTLQVYLNEGSPHKAYKEFDTLITKSDNKGMKRLSKYLSYTPLYPQHYRIRKTEEIASQKDLFHVPFELRHMVSTNRYSIPGYPTLYLSNSIFLAYKELGEQDYKNLYVSKFYFTEHFNQQETLLDLTNKPKGNDFSSKFKYLARWILIMACNIKVGHEKAPFKEEYIISQIILQWVKNNIKIGSSKKVLGVAYSSTRIIENENFYGHFYNTAIPIHHSSPKGHCNIISKLFKLTKPFNFEDISKISADVNIKGQVKSIDVDGHKVNYVDTDFGKLEHLLSLKEYNKLTRVYD